MRLKRSEFKQLKTDVSILKDIVKQNSEKFKIIEINDKLRDYGLFIEYNTVESYWWNIDFGFIIYDNESNEVVKKLDTLSDFDKRFDWYKQWIEDGDIFVIEECDCDWCKDDTVDEYDDSYTSYCSWTQWIVWPKWDKGDKWDRWPRWPKWESYKETKKVLKPNQKK